MEVLHHALQSTQFGSGDGGKTMESEDAIEESAVASGTSHSPAYKFRKSDVLSEAINYVHQAELEMRRMSNDIHALCERVAALEKQARKRDADPPAA
jgi:hypothetical protein